LAALAAGIDPAIAREAVMAFEALPHRLELVGTIDGVDYVDDSKATNPGSVIAALRSFDRPIVLIAGGKAKGTDFAELGKVASSRTKAVVLIGEAADAIAPTIKRAHVHRADSMREAIEIAGRTADAGDIVLLSPGCASFDMFSSAEARGDEFIKIVQERITGALSAT
jgi:UDP-N-acetylmuramoylalanine--D-glutamate ligase